MNDNSLEKYMPVFSVEEQAFLDNNNKYFEDILVMDENITSTENNGIYAINATTKENLNVILMKTLGISYEEFTALNHEQQQIIINEYYNRPFKITDNDGVYVMVGSGASSIILNVKTGERIIIGAKAHSFFVESGSTPRKYRIKEDKPLSLVRKITNKFKR